MVSEHSYSADSYASYKAGRLSHRCVYRASIFDIKERLSWERAVQYYHAPITESVVLNVYIRIRHVLTIPDFAYQTR